jgi:hypothetical protein
MVVAHHRAFDQITYDTKKKELGFELSCLQGQLDDLPDPKNIRHEREEYVEMMKELVTTYLMGNVTERRQLLRNTFSTRQADASGVQLVVRSWIGVQMPTTPTKKHHKSIVLG